MKRLLREWKRFLGEAFYVDKNLSKPPKLVKLENTHAQILTIF